MRVYQSIHKYPLHIPAFEAKHGINDDTKISFSELQKLIIDDGYACVYRLEPPITDKSSEVFFTVWNYERLQKLWAKEHGVDPNSRMSDIRAEQVKWFKPDVVYDFSGRYSPHFIPSLKKAGIKAVFVLWNGVIEDKEIPTSIPNYDIYISLHRPYITHWKEKGLSSFELQPSIPAQWLSSENNSPRTIDILMYGQSHNDYFKERNKIVKKILTLNSKYKISIKLQIDDESKEVFGEKVKLMQAPVYAGELYETIKNTKIVINKCTDHNSSFKSNMRIFEAIGNGALLISEEGNYPEGLTPGKDFLTYKSTDELYHIIERVLSDWEKWANFAQKAKKRVLNNFTKEKQWWVFSNNILEYRNTN